MVNYLIYKLSQDINNICAKAIDEGVPVFAVRYVLQDAVTTATRMTEAAVQRESDEIQNRDTKSVSVRNSEVT